MVIEITVQKVASVYVFSRSIRWSNIYFGPTAIIKGAKMYCLEGLRAQRRTCVYGGFKILLCRRKLYAGIEQMCLGSRFFRWVCWFYDSFTWNCGLFGPSRVVSVRQMGLFFRAEWNVIGRTSVRRHRDKSKLYDFNVCREYFSLFLEDFRKRWTWTNLIAVR